MDAFAVAAVCCEMEESFLMGGGGGDPVSVKCSQIESSG